MKLPKLPSGVSIFRDHSGDTEYWVLRLGKRWTGGHVVRRTFPSAGEARRAWEKEVSKRESLGTGSYELSPSQLGEAIACFRQLEGTGLSLSHAVKLSLKGFRPKSDLRSPVRCHQTFLVGSERSWRSREDYYRLSVLFAPAGERLPTKTDLHEITDKEVRKHLRQIRETREP